MLTDDVDSPLLPIGTNIGAVEVAEGPDGGDVPRDQATSLFRGKRGLGTRLGRLQAVEGGAHPAD